MSLINKGAQNTVEGQLAWCCLQSFFFFFWLPSFPLQRAATILQTVAMSELKRELYIMSMSSRVATNDGVCGGDGKVETVDRRFRVLSGQSCEATSGNHPQWVKAVRRDAFMA